jgi:hypothetical protein
MARNRPKRSKKPGSGRPASGPAPTKKPATPEDDRYQAWMLAANCLIYEADPGPETTQVGSINGPLTVSKQEAVQIIYARNVLTEMDADLARLRAAAEACHRVAAETAETRPKYAAENARGADLCERAAQLVIEAGASSNGKARRRLLAVTEFESALDTLGAIPAVVDSAREELEEKLREIDAEPSPTDGVPADLPYKGPTYDPATGRFRAGEGANGHVGYWELNTPGEKVCNGLIAGPAQIGKSSVLRLVLVEAIQAERFVLWTADPSGRGELPGPVEPAVKQSAGTPKETKTMLEAALAVIDNRAKTGGFTDPSTERPGLLIAIENFHSLVADDLQAAELAERVATTGGPAGVGLVVTVPDVDLAHFGGSKALRDALAAGNAFPMGPDALRMARELGVIES